MRFDKLIRLFSSIEDSEKTLSDCFAIQVNRDAANAIKGIGSDVIKTALISRECKAVLNIIGDPNVVDNLKMDYLKIMNRIWNNKIHVIDASNEEKTFVVAIQEAERNGLVWLVEQFEEFLSNTKES